MPRVRVAKPEASDIAEDPRSFAVYKAIKADTNDGVDVEALNKFIQLYGGSGLAKDEAELKFKEFSELFATQSKVTYPGEGNCVGYGAKEAGGAVEPLRFERRATGPNDVRFQIAYAGICHSDLHQVKNDWKMGSYPMVPGHEIVGYVTEVGANVTKYKIGDAVGVGCLVNSCKTCTACTEMKEEQFCPKAIFTYAAPDVDGTSTKGGYSNFLVCDQDFVLRIPDSLPLDASAPLLCAGITVYSPIRHYGLDKPGMKVGVMGLGGLGHMAVKILKAMGVTVTVISTSPSKKEEALSVLGADTFVISKNEDEMKANSNTLDGIINTISGTLELAPYLGLLKLDGKLVYVGAPAQNPTLPVFLCLFKRITVGGSVIGGLKETQEMLEFCGQKGVASMVEVIDADYINTAYERMEKNDVRYRFVINVLKSITE
uniref:Enoyl reductase (ER) domain-containing protein n=1 Tax=Polytomella parva TaxID=51329 RepID=A0A7S0UZI6_9CHLO|mmetsp:Transcript_23604/g.42020  ORF Transcript_23604/g.42020 Transcript_23604/m.42020 type:complete len:430 (+) Transcript_23604:88-1377(+)|eukprot:CAMPEP_0175050064 /NCGR_PEP_ID=MMETSP0052_2-20121109/7065_1 /TAXON_ID=51329 ORGANISM="Polytomella parva, Strain SAG 63-3" /NCGR_SAMPLE_ID=MMETSP0052_2 /ASSEMBLY_ACC=CAM_ASM_000194 /LENGTH=429 /DNA_ID=CAMNT_0016314253 /DNA_START=26 /DNA_END=1315 /DNA_ORIENTATION=-